jgi:DNA polymerase I-like protein with 3'-5' exonuclease and polymerase domains
MKIYNTASLNEQSMKKLSPDEAAHIYNGLDVCVTAEIYNVLKGQLLTDNEGVQTTYRSALAKLAPIMEMSLRGTLIDEDARQSTMKDLEVILSGLDSHFQQIIIEVIGYNMNWRSPVQLKYLFYDVLKIKPIKKRNQKGQYVPTVGKEALEQFQIYLYAAPLARFILIMRDLSKQISFLRTEIDRDQRIRTTYNIAGTNTGRLASSMSEFGTGTNMQNVNRKLRSVFHADRDMYMLNVDLEQADGRNVGAICYNLFIDMPREQVYELAKDDPRLASFVKDEKWIGPIGQELAAAYLDACEGGDLHTTVCKMVWPDEIAGQKWPTDESMWKKFCDGIMAHGQDSFRQLSKKGGHGTNYFGTPRTMAKHLHTPTVLITNFQNSYFTQFPAIPLWHNWVIREIREHGTITTLFGRRRMFFGRASDASTYRKAIAYEPQSMTGEQIDRGLLQIWRAFPQVHLLNQVHDSILIQQPFNRSTELTPKILEAMSVSLPLKHGRVFTMPLDAAGGWNWGYAGKSNLPGLKGWSGKELREPPLKQTNIRRAFKK